MQRPFFSLRNNITASRPPLQTFHWVLRLFPASHCFSHIRSVSTPLLWIRCPPTTSPFLPAFLPLSLPQASPFSHPVSRKPRILPLLPYCLYRLPYCITSSASFSYSFALLVDFLYTFTGFEASCAHSMAESTWIKEENT